MGAWLGSLNWLVTMIYFIHLVVTLCTNDYYLPRSSYYKNAMTDFTTECEYLFHINSNHELNSARQTYKLFFKRGSTIWHEDEEYWYKANWDVFVGNHECQVQAILGNSKRIQSCCWSSCDDHCHGRMGLNKVVIILYR